MLAGVTLKLGKALRGGVDLKKLGKALKGGIDVDKAFGRRHKQRPPAGGSSATVHSTAERLCEGWWPS